jgi:hypothetical protein
MSQSEKKRYHDGRAIILDHDTIVPNEYGIRVRRREIILEDGQQILEDYSLDGDIDGYHPQPSAPLESEVNRQTTASSSIPLVQATVVPFDTPTSPPTTPSSTPITQMQSAMIPAGGPESQVQIVQGPTQVQPYAMMPPSRYVYRDETTGVCLVCGLSLLACFSLCCCCLVPVIVLPVWWVFSWTDGEY